MSDKEPCGKCDYHRPLKCTTCSTEGYDLGVKICTCKDKFCKGPRTAIETGDCKQFAPSKAK